MKILKPDDLAFLYRASRFARRNTLAIAMLGYFDFARSERVHLLPEAELWQAAAAALGKDALLDEGNPKPRGEYKVYGAAYAPHGREVARQRVHVRIGALEKALIVSGDRQFNIAGLPSEPKPYARMPIEPATTFGGEGYAENPAGKGFAAVLRDGREVWPLPNVEREAQPLLTRGERITPAGFWAYGIGTPQRQQYLGRCDDRWLKSDWPHLPADTRLELFMSAPQDQWAPGYFKGDETFELRNLHPCHEVLQGQLPGLRARCFIYGGARGSEVLREVEARAETVWLFPELERGIVLYRAVADVADSDAGDVSHVMAEWEPQAVPPLPFEHYRDRFLAQLPGAAAAVPAAPPELQVPAAAQAPALAPAAMAAAAPAAAMAAAPGVESAFAETERLVDKLNQETRALMQKHGLTAKDLEPYMTRPAEGAPPSFADVEKMAEDLSRETRALMHRHNLTDADLAPYLKPPAEPAPPTGASLQGLLTQLHEETQAVMKKTGLTEVDVRALIASRPELADLAKQLSPAGFAPPQLDAASLAMFAPPLPQAPKPPPLPGMPGMPELAQALPPAPAGPLTREDVVARHAAHKSLAGLELSGLDLSGLDLSGADFSSTMLDKTSFAKSKLQNVDFSKALLMETDFAEADLQQAVLAQTSGGAGKFTKADLRGAKLLGGDFTAADFGGARLESADLSGAQFTRAAMAGVNAEGCRAVRAQFDGCVLDGANFSRAALAEANFSGSSAKGGNFAHACCERTDFHGVEAHQASFIEANLSASRADKEACFDGAQFVRARLDRASWGSAQLRGALLEQASLDDADLSGAVATAASLRFASAKGAKFERADLSGADCTGINLFRGSLRKTKIDGARLTDANLYGVDFDETRPTLAAIERSNIDRTSLQFRPPTV
ncbi:DUF2169 family type VI secretion system accessory protein [Paraburkholderia sacchari]|uniref:DUF2169 family type VI secretion system accessory protein n=1 Tax=Paraburkholderia sacchari TaxID=159450 RepID=UPI001BD1A75F|nr:DUF2169 domain-containing protein [Paraburkholderia sacchari]